MRASTSACAAILTENCRAQPQGNLRVNDTKKTILSGIQPSSNLHLGNYLGAVKNWLNLQDQYHCYFMMVDLHAITSSQNPEQLRESSYMGIAAYLAAGIDPLKSYLFIQSHVPAHAELAWVLTCFTYMGELNRMTQFKDKSQKQGQNIPAGLFVYPVLMAADILLYQPHLVPVGDDQKQHIEITRNLAERLNQRYQKELFRIPAPLIAEQGARIMDLQNPQVKMSKSAENPKGVIFVSDSDKQISQKIKSAVTDSGSEFAGYDSASLGMKNLLDIYASLSNQSAEQVAAHFTGKMYGHIKTETADLVVSMIAPIRNKMLQLMDDKAYLDTLLEEGAQKAKSRAEATLTKVYDALGFLPYKSR